MWGCSMHWVAWGCNSADLCLGRVFCTFNSAGFWAQVLCGSLWWGPKCHTGLTWVCEPIEALGAMHPWPPGPNLGLGQVEPPGRPHMQVQRLVDALQTQPQAMPAMLMCVPGAGGATTCKQVRACVRLPQHHTHSTPTQLHTTLLLSFV